ncbi:MAG: tRNA (cytidine(34)-2'-O)-methyltransferase [Gemmataceae bacterium]
MFHVVLFEPEIAANTGNIGRLCLAVGATLHLVGRLGFHLDDRSLRRAGLDYWPDVTLRRHDCLADFEALFPADRIFCLSAHGQTPYTQPRFQIGDVFVFGSESRGLPQEVRDRHEKRILTIPQPTGKVRSLNLANSVAIVVYEALRQCTVPGQ